MDRVQRTRAKGSKLPPNTLCVTRGTLFGNPFKKHYARETGERVVNLFEEWVHHPAQTKLRKDFIWACENMDIEHLACWCGFGEKCHADVWLYIWDNHNIPFTDSTPVTPAEEADRREAGGL